MVTLSHRFAPPGMTLLQKLGAMSWGLVALLMLTAGLGFAMLYSAANGSMQPWAMPQLARFGIGLLLLIGVALIDVRLVMRYSYVFYALVMVLLVVVDVRGAIGGGAQRWIDFGFINLQPSELMKPAIVLALARYFQGVGLDDIGHPLILAVPMALIGAPFVLIAIQPDLGTAGVIVMGSAAMLFLAGVRLWKFILVGLSGLAAIPIAWSMLREYQQKRILTFLNPETDPLGSGYHILQSKIALGSGGLFGKGFMAGTQSHLNFLPERQTDFIFTMLAEELGMVGGLALLTLYVILLIYGYAIAFRCRHQFGRLVAVGITAGFFLYVFINIAMVMGLIPVVGVTLPFISYGGTSLLTLMLCVGLLMNIHVHRDVHMGVRGGFNDF